MVPVTVYAEMTPNPTTMKYVANKYLLATGDAVEFSSKADSKGYSPLAEALFDFPFVQKVFIAANFITITKTDNVPWDFINMELREFVREWLFFGKEVLIQMPSQLAQMEDESSPEKPAKTFNPSDIDDPIRALKGSCAGCPSSTATLKGGIENLLKQHLPEVKEVVALNG